MTDSVAVCPVHDLNGMITIALINDLLIDADSIHTGCATGCKCDINALPAYIQIAQCHVLQICVNGVKGENGIIGFESSKVTNDQVDVEGMVVVRFVTERLAGFTVIEFYKERSVRIMPLKMLQGVFAQLFGESQIIAMLVLFGLAR